MRILGIHTGHNATVALLEDGEITAALSQERVDNVKNSCAFPAGAIRAVLESRGLSVDAIDEIAIAGRDVFPERCYAYLFDSDDRVERAPLTEIARRLERTMPGRMVPWLFSALRGSRRKALLAEGRRELAANLAAVGLGSAPRTHVEHHECHARAAYHALDRTDGQEPALILTLDGSGDGLCATVTRFDPARGWVRLAATPARASLGGIYSLTTRFLGMKILEHEYKVMGLAPYGRDHHLDAYRRIFEPVLDLDAAEPLRFASAFDTSRFLEHLTRHAVGVRFDHLAGALQHLLEERVIVWVRAAVARSGIGRVYTGGGVFMNVKVNKRIQELPEVDRASFMPSCGDESNALGAAYALGVRRGVAVRPLRDLYLGPAYPESQIEALIGRLGLRDRYRVVRLDEPEEKIAALLADRQVVARFAGRGEWGARSLGNRAILAHPGYLESFHTVNDQIKARDFWMPFAPTILETAAERYLEGYDAKKVEPSYMITAFAATPLGIEHLRGAMHQADHTIRPQVLLEDANPSYYRTIKAFERRTGIGAVLNTSLNLHGSPLAGALEQAVATFERSGLRYLALERFLITKDAS
jgi:carbamoyltransferase